MGEPVLPAPDAPAEEWGRLAVSLPGWPYRTPGGCGRMDDGIDWIPSDAPDWNAGGAGHPVPDPDDPSGATAGCLLALLGAAVRNVQHVNGQWAIVFNDGRGVVERTAYCRSIGRACIAAAAALGRWPGGEH